MKETQALSPRHTSPSQTFGKQLEESPAIQTLLDNLVKEVMSLSQHIQGVKGPDKNLEASAQKNIEGIGSLRGRPLFYNYMGSGLGRGPYVELEDGSVKLDLINGIGIHLFGHSHPRLIRAQLQGALGDIVHQGNLQPNHEYLTYSETLARIASRNSRLKYVWLATCGTIANENALKIARQKRRGARKIVTFKNAFAGRSTMMAEITDNPSFKVGLPEYNEVLRLPFYSPQESGDSSALKTFKEHIAKHGKDIGCFVFEPMLGEGGYRSAPREFFVPLLELCRQNGIPIWWDEIQTFTRTGNFFAFETLGLGEFVDVCTIAKTAQNGATFFTEEFKPDAGLLGGTFSGSTGAMSAGMEGLKMLEEGGYLGPKGKVQSIHREFVDMLNSLNTTTCKGLLRDAGGLGLMVAVTPLDGTKEKQTSLLKALFKNGLICFGCGSDPYRIRFLLPAVLTTADIQAAKNIFEKTIAEAAHAPASA